MRVVCLIILQWIIIVLLPSRIRGQVMTQSRACASLTMILSLYRLLRHLIVSFMALLSSRFGSSATGHLVSVLLPSPALTSIILIAINIVISRRLLFLFLSEVVLIRLFIIVALFVFLWRGQAAPSIFGSCRSLMQSRFSLLRRYFTTATATNFKILVVLLS